jgi:hypothetical protein
MRVVVKGVNGKPDVEYEQMVRIKGVEYDGDPGKLRFSEAKRIEQVSGLTYYEWGAALRAGSATASQTLVWILMRRDQPDLRFDATEDMEMDDLEFVNHPLPPPLKSATATKRAAPTKRVGPVVDPTPKAS